MTQCIFCNIVTKAEPANIIYEDERIIAFFDKFPAALGHTLVIPKAHKKSIDQLSESELLALFTTVQRMVRQLGRKFNTNMLTIGINHGEISGIPHFHVHIIPRFPNDGGGIIQSVVYNKAKKSSY